MTSPTTTIDLGGDRKRLRRERRVRGAFWGAALFSVLLSGLIVLSLIGEAVNFLRTVEWSALWDIGWFPRRGMFDVRTIVVATMIIAGIAMLVAAPLGLGAAIYLSEYASPRMRRILKPVLEILAGIPSVVIGYFALTWLSPNLIQPIFNAEIFNMLAAGIGVGVLTTPLVASVSEDALRAVPQALREASYGLGARKSATVRKIVVPAAVSGIMAALILGVSRAIGETMVVAMAAGATGGGLLTFDPLQPGITMTAAMASLAIGTDQVAGAGNAFQSLFFVGMLLFIMTLGLNLISDRFVRRVRGGY
ncbi:MAG TPA: phosphate ABC transporter permease subunit PstC [Acidimicrobiia bacterium]